jgi:hypothetical protein
MVSGITSEFRWPARYRLRVSDSNGRRPLITSGSRPPDEPRMGEYPVAFEAYHLGDRLPGCLLVSPRFQRAGEEVAASHHIPEGHRPLAPPDPRNRSRFVNCPLSSVPPCTPPGRTPWSSLPECRGLLRPSCRLRQGETPQIAPHRVHGGAIPASRKETPRRLPQWCRRAGAVCPAYLYQPASSLARHRSRHARRPY